MTTTTATPETSTNNVRTSSKEIIAQDVAKAKAKAEAEKATPAEAIKAMTPEQKAKAVKDGAKAMAKAVLNKKEAKPTMAAKFDELLTKGGTWENLIVKAQAAATEMKSNIKVNKGVLRAHVVYRVKKNPQYLGKLTMTDTGISAPKGKK